MLQLPQHPSFLWPCVHVIVTQNSCSVVVWFFRWLLRWLLGCWDDLQWLLGCCYDLWWLLGCCDDLRWLLQLEEYCVRFLRLEEEQPVGQLLWNLRWLPDIKQSPEE